MVLLAHKFRKFLRIKDPLTRSKNSFKKPIDREKEKEKDRDERKERSNVCFRYNKLGHLRIDCPLEKIMLENRCSFHGEPTLGMLH